MNKEKYKFIRTLSIEASAGSGKTYQLAKRFIYLLSYYLKSIQKNSNFKICKISQSPESEEFILPETLGSIVAITFTNKAAAEMKERVILFLKYLVNIYNDEKFNKEDFDIKEKDALTLLVDIIKNHGDFNITTIDSFMNKILKAFAIDLNIYPDYEITFNREEIFQLTIDDIFSNPDNFDDLLNFLKNYLPLANKGVNPEKIIINGIKDFKDVDIPENIITFYELGKRFNLVGNNLSDIESEIENRLSPYFSYFEDIINQNKNIFHGNQIKRFKDLNLKKFLERDKFKAFKEIVEDNSLKRLYRKNNFLDRNIEKEFLINLKECISIGEKFLLLRETFESYAVSALLKKYKEKEIEIKSYLNIVDGSKIAKDLSNILKREDGVNYAFCRLGEKITHYLIDEFQDTSNEQFDAIFPLIENAVSQGGSLFLVGDKKQAIYAWRGGDYTIFDKVLEKEYLTLTQENINRNFRSAKNIVEFNNKVFDVKNIFNEDFKEVLKNYDSSLSIKLEKAIKDVYKNSFQQNFINSEGYIEVNLKDNEEVEQNEEFYSESLIEVLKRLIFNKGIKPSDIMILLRKKDNIDFVVSWIREYLPEIPFITEDSLILLNNYEIKRFLLLLSAIVYSDDYSYKSALKIVNINEMLLKDLKEDVKLLSPYEIFCKLLSLEIFNLKDNKLYFDKLLEEVLKLTESQKSIEDILDYFYNNKDITVTISDDIDALKIMTIHKAKGLESHTVIIPFYDWNIYKSFQEKKFETVDISPITGNPNDQAFININGSLKNILPDVKEKFINNNITNFIESLNLMYVANTRARENLFIIGVYKKVKKGKTITASSLLNMILQKIYKDIKYPLTIGDLKTAKNKDCKNEIQNIKSYKINPSFRKFLKVYPENYFLNLTPIEKLDGELYHLSMSFIGTIEDKNFDDKIDKAYKKASKILRYENRNILKFIKKTLIDLYDYYYEIDDYWNEKEVVNENGDIFRIDRIVKKNNNFYVIDFKTGKKEEKHKLQVKRYLSFFSNAKGIIYYVNTGEKLSVI